jgi:GNAT superfamily N-acetyltransferase
MRIRQARAGGCGGDGRGPVPDPRRWGSDRPRGPEHVLARYIRHPARISCCVAETGGSIVGFQSLKRAMAGNPYDLPEGWGIIGTYVAAAAAGQGVGRALFAESLRGGEGLGLAVDRRDDRARRTRRGWGITRRWALRTGAT